MNGHEHYRDVVIVTQHQPLIRLQHQQQQQLPDPAPMIPDNIPTRLNSAVASSSLLRPQEPGDLLPPKYEPTNLDICSGRGKRYWNHIGNVVFRDIIQRSTPAYMAAPTKVSKTTIVCNIVEEMRALGCNFLKEDKATGRWYDMGDAQAREKVGHSLRDQVTAYNRSNNQEPTNEDGMTSPDPSTHCARRPSLTLSDSGNEAEQRRMTLDTTAMFGQFARRPSWIVGEMENISDPNDNKVQQQNDDVDKVEPSQVGNRSDHTTGSTMTTSAATPVPVSENSSVAPINHESYCNDIHLQPTGNVIPSDVRCHRGDIRQAIMIPNDSRHSMAPPNDIRQSMLMPNDIRHSMTIPNEFRQSMMIPNDFRQSITIPNEFRHSTTMTDIQNWDPMISINSIPTDAMMHESVLSWDPRLSGSNSLMSIQRRSGIMAGGTTLRRLTNSFRGSDLTFDNLLIDMESDYETDVFMDAGTRRKGIENQEATKINAPVRNF